jgi:hypothetical protein
LAKGPILAGAIVAYAALSILASLARSFAELLALRALLGLALAAIITTSGALIGDLLSGEARAAALGRQAVLRGVSAAIAPVIGGLAAGLHWRLSLLVNAAAFVLVPGTTSLLRRRPSETAPARRLDTSSVAGPYASVFGGWLILYLLTLQIGFHLKSLSLTAPIWPGLALGASSMAAALAGSRLTRMRARLSFQRLTALAFAAISAGYLLISLSTMLSTGFGIVLAGAAIGTITANSTAWLLASVPAELRGRSMGGFAVAMFAGQIASLVVLGPLVTWIGVAATFATVGGAGLGLVLLLQARHLLRGTVPAQSAPDTT